MFTSRMATMLASIVVAAALGGCTSAAVEDDEEVTHSATSGSPRPATGGLETICERDDEQADTESEEGPGWDLGVDVEGGRVTVPLPRGRLDGAAESNADENDPDPVAEGRWLSDASAADAAKAYHATLTSAGFTVDPGKPAKDFMEGRGVDPSADLWIYTGKGLVAVVAIADRRGCLGSAINVVFTRQGTRREDHMRGRGDFQDQRNEE